MWCVSSSAKEALMLQDDRRTRSGTAALVMKVDIIVLRLCSGVDASFCWGVDQDEFYELIGGCCRRRCCC